MKVEKFIYESTEIHFLLGGGDDVKVNATEMANAFGKTTTHFLTNKQTKDFIKVLDSKLGIPSLEVVRGGNNPGTWMHRKLALKFAAWLDAEFELWIIETVEKVMFSNYDSHLKALNAQHEEKNRFDALVRRATYEQNELALQIIESHRRLERFTKDKRNALRRQGTEVRNLFSSQDEEENM